MTGCDQTCATCAWWIRQGPRLATTIRDPSASPDTGTCQVHAPMVVQGNSSFPVALFPTTHESRFCGDWQACHEGGGDDGERVIAFPQRQAA